MFVNQAFLVSGTTPNHSKGLALTSVLRLLFKKYL
jgi:hypothetical protein